MTDSDMRLRNVVPAALPLLPSAWRWEGSAARIGLHGLQQHGEEELGRHALLIAGALSRGAYWPALYGFQTKPRFSEVL